MSWDVARQCWIGRPSKLQDGTWGASIADPQYAVEVGQMVEVQTQAGKNFGTHKITAVEYIGDSQFGGGKYVKVRYEGGGRQQQSPPPAGGQAPAAQQQAPPPAATQQQAPPAAQQQAPADETEVVGLLKEILHHVSNCDARLRNIDEALSKNDDVPI